MADWLEFQKGTQDLGSRLGDYFRQKKAQEDAIQMILLKAKADYLSDPLKQAQAQFLNRILSGQNISPQTNAIDTTGINEARQTVGVERQPYPESFNIGGFGFKFPTPPEIEKQQVEREQQKADIKQTLTARKALDTYTSDALQSLIAIDKIKSQAQNLPKFKRGLFPQATARLSTGLGKFSKNKEITRYLGVVSQELIPMARKLMEEKGPITEFDVSRVEKGLGDLTAPLEDKLFLLKELENKVRLAITNKMQVANLDEQTFSNKYQNLYKRLFGNNIQSENIQSESSDYSKYLQAIGAQ